MGTTFKPVTQVTDTEVKRRSKKDISTTLDIGKDKRNVPVPITKRKEARRILPGDILENLALIIKRP